MIKTKKVKKKVVKSTKKDIKKMKSNYGLKPIKVKSKKSVLVQLPLFQNQNNERFILYDPDCFAATSNYKRAKGLL